MMPGGVRSLLPSGFKKRMLDNLDEITQILKDVDSTLFTNAVFKKRTVGVGYIDPLMVNEYGITGPNARAAGVLRDVRVEYPYLKYPELDFEPSMGKDSDIYTRARVRYNDTFTTIDLIKQILSKMPQKGPFMADMPNALHFKIPRGETYIRGECTRGEFGYYTVTDGSGYPRRINARGPSYAHGVALVEKLGINLNIADLAAFMVSLHIYPPEIER
jgi:NADH-quinone oxidoreductase subunit D